MLSSKVGVYGRTEVENKNRKERKNKSPISIFWFHVRFVRNVFSSINRSGSYVYEGNVIRHICIYIYISFPFSG